MERLEVRAPKSSFSNGSGAKLVKWMVREGEDVDEGMRIATVEKANASKLDVLAPRSGTMVGVGVKIGEEVKENIPICSIEFCTHAVIFGGLCTICGRDLSMVHFSQDVPSAQRVNVAYESGLVVSRDEARRTETDKARHLLDRRLLSLVLDLDHTLLHATDDPRAKAALIMDDQSPKTPGTPMLSPAYHSGIHQLVLDGKSFFVKLRPGLGNFLRRMKKKFELHIYTMGTRPYADSIAAIIDPERTLFGERLTSRDDFEEGSLNQKNLRRVFPCDDTMVLIVDDREDVWLEDRSSRMPNLIKARPYHFFKGLHEAYDRTSKAPIETGGGSMAKKKAIPSEEKPVPSKAANDSTSTKENHNLENSPSELPGKGIHEDTKSCPEASEPAKASTAEKKTPEALDINLEELVNEQDIAQSGKEEIDPNVIKLVEKWWNADRNEGFHLQQLATVLEDIHDRYFAATNSTAPVAYGADWKAPADVKHIVTHVRLQVLKGCHFAFTGIFPPSSQVEVVQSTEQWILAERHGAKCYMELNPQITHLVVHPERGTTTKKAETARGRNGVFSVLPSFLEETAETFHRASELQHKAFPLRSEFASLDLDSYRKAVRKSYEKYLKWYDIGKSKRSLPGPASETTTKVATAENVADTRGQREAADEAGLRKRKWEESGADPVIGSSEVGNEKLKAEM
ncbi:hypothetical protein NDN08_006811 [Rhodosorus marinus]|uniref:RNA polymerase II subunit A C-terminal domain phosphatase n=1 Tax=Rhodosorus marinus TaxID=101924 RepID=A0AAV8UIR8_9RHOD|nr:hypothetical protein NDN08_006811 [Rhodosorus marinus]